MENLINTINEVEQIENSIDSLVRYVSYCYVNNVTTIAHLVTYKSKVFDCSYNYVLSRVVEYIGYKYKNMRIDLNELMLYLDYYLEKK